MSELNKEDIVRTVTESDINLNEVQRIISEQKKWYERQQAAGCSEKDKLKLAEENKNFLISQDNIKHMYLVAAWRKFKCGLASMYEQQLCYEIHKYQMKFSNESNSSSLLKGARAYHYWKRWSPDIKQSAIDHIAAIDGISGDTVRKQLEVWEKIELEANAISDEGERAEFWDSVYKSKHKLVKKTLFPYKNPFN